MHPRRSWLTWRRSPQREEVTNLYILVQIILLHSISKIKFETDAYTEILQASCGFQARISKSPILVTMQLFVQSLFRMCIFFSYMLLKFVFSLLLFASLVECSDICNLMKDEDYGWPWIRHMQQQTYEGDDRFQLSLDWATDQYTCLGFIRKSKPAWQNTQVGLPILYRSFAYTYVLTPFSA